MFCFNHATSGKTDKSLKLWPGLWIYPRLGVFHSGEEQEWHEAVCREGHSQAAPDFQEPGKRFDSILPSLL